MPARDRSSRHRYQDYRKRRATEPHLVSAVADDPTGRRKSQKANRPFLTLLRRFWGVLGSNRRGVIAALGTVTIATLLNLSMLASPKLIIDYAITDKPGPAGIPEWLALTHDRRELLWLISGGVVVIALVSVGVSLWGRWQMTLLTKKVQVRLRRLAFERAVRLPLHRVHALKSGGIASMLRDDAGGAGELIFTMLYNPWRAIVQLIGTIIVLTVVDWRLVVGAIALLPIIWYTHHVWIKRIRPIYRDIRLTRQGIDARSTEVFGGMRIVRGFGRERGEAGSFVTGTHFMARQEILAWWRARAVDMSWQVLVPLASAGVMLYGGMRVIDGDLTLGDLMLFSGYLLALLGPLETLASTATQIQTQLAGFDRTLDLLDESLEFDGSRDGVVLDRASVRGDMAFEHVSFRYPGGNEDVLRDISLQVKAGETIALVGASGAGKTTLCNLAARFFDPTAGVIRFDGIDLREIDIDSYRSLLGVVEQDVFLFDGTVGENIAYARPGATDEDIEEAARIANASGFIHKTERAYDTVIGERGVRLSGGQKQRIAIARAVLADPRLLILDEATSSLDTESEQLIQASLARLMQGRTSFVIAHRLSTIRHADRIVVIEDGHIVESGTHDELIEASGRYAELLEKQVAPPEAGAVAQ